MKFSGSTDINKARDIVASLFADPENLKHYQDGFVKKELVSGTPGVDGAVSKMYYSNNGREMVLEETIVANRLPERFEATYSHPMMNNTMKCEFTASSENQMRYSIEVEYTAINGFVPKMMALLFPGLFTRQGKKWMENFKTFVENH